MSSGADWFRTCEGCEYIRTEPWPIKGSYCHPYSAYERGNNENINSMIRWFFPKGTNFDEASDKDIRRAADWINSYPRRVLGWRSAGRYEGVSGTGRLNRT